MHARTLFDKLWDSHAVRAEADGTTLLYIDRHLVHEVTSPQAYEGLRLAGRNPWRAGSIVATADHNTPTTDWAGGIRDPISRTQVETLDANIRAHGAKAYFPFLDRRQGIVHVIGPEQGATLPGMTVVCGDSHTSTHGAFAALAFGIGTSEVEHVLATQCLLMKKQKSMLIRVEGQLGHGVTAKDLALAIIGRIGTAGGTGHAIEFAGSAIRALSMEARMTLCNMSIEAGARAGMIAVDDKTIDYLRGRPFAPTGDLWDRAVAHWRTLVSDEGATFDTVVVQDAAQVTPQVTWGTSPEMVVSVDGRVPDPDKEKDATRRDGIERALTYMGLAPQYADRRYPSRQDIHRLVHQFADRGPARRRGHRQWPARCLQHQAGAGRSRIGARQNASRTRRARSHLSRRRFRVARARLLDVPRDERRSPVAGRALRIDVESQFRGPAGRWRPYPSGQSGDGRCGSDRRAFRRCASPRLTGGSRRKYAEQICGIDSCSPGSPSGWPVAIRWKVPART
jgi:3-isopropylmalate/(R)-2-methylmalate dehydratase large subunit